MCDVFYLLLASLASVNSREERSSHIRLRGFLKNSFVGDFRSVWWSSLNRWRGGEGGQVWLRCSSGCIASVSVGINSRARSKDGLFHLAGCVALLTCAFWCNQSCHVLY